MISTVRNAIRIIDCFSHDTLELSLSEIAQSLGMNKSTVHHLVKTLRDEGILIKTKNNLYALSLKLFQWGSLVNVRNQIVSLAVPHLHELVEQTGENIHMGVLHREEVYFITKSGMPSSMPVNTKIGLSVPPHCTALGKVLLAHSEESAVRRIAAKGLEARSAKTITCERALLEELDQARESGFSVDRGEYVEGLYCFAAKITDPLGDCIAAISVSGPEKRMVQNQESIRNSLLSTAASISGAIADSIQAQPMHIKS